MDAMSRIPTARRTYPTEALCRAWVLVEGWDTERASSFLSLLEDYNTEWSKNVGCRADYGEDLPMATEAESKTFTSLLHFAKSFQNV